MTYDTYEIIAANAVDCLFCSGYIAGEENMGKRLLDNKYCKYIMCGMMSLSCAAFFIGCGSKDYSDLANYSAYEEASFSDLDSKFANDGVVAADNANVAENSDGGSTSDSSGNSTGSGSSSLSNSASSVTDSGSSATEVVEVVSNDGSVIKIVAPVSSGTSSSTGTASNSGTGSSGTASSGGSDTSDRTSNGTGSTETASASSSSTPSCEEDGNHDYSLYVAPTCLEWGATWCSICKKKYINPEEPTGQHNYVNGTCTVCGAWDGSSSSGSSYDADAIRSAIYSKSGESCSSSYYYECFHNHLNGSNTTGKYKGYGPTSYAVMLSDTAFGDASCSTTTIDNVQVGDIIRLGYGTTGVVIVVLTVDGDSFTGVYCSPSGADWGYSGTLSACDAIDVLTRY